MEVFEGKGDILADREMRIQGILLENHRQIPKLGHDAFHVLPVNQKLPGRHILKARNHPKYRALAAARRPVQNDKLARINRQAVLLHRNNAFIRGIGHPPLLLQEFLCLLPVKKMLPEINEGIDFYDIAKFKLCHNVLPYLFLKSSSHSVAESSAGAFSVSEAFSGSVYPFSVRYFWIIRSQLPRKMSI